LRMGRAEQGMRGVRLVTRVMRGSLFAVRAPCHSPGVALLRQPPPFRPARALGKTNWQAFQGVRIGYDAARIVARWHQRYVVRAEPLPCVR